MFVVTAAAHANLHHQSTVPMTGICDQCANNCAFGKGLSNFRTALTVCRAKICHFRILAALWEQCTCTNADPGPSATYCQ